MAGKKKLQELIQKEKEERAKLIAEHRAQQDADE